MRPDGGSRADTAGVTWFRACPSFQETSSGLCPPAGADAAPGSDGRLSLSLQRQSNASQTLCDIVRLGREQGGQLPEALEPDPLLAVLES